MVNNVQGGLTKFFMLVLVVLKFPTFFAFGLALRQRGAQFSGLGIRGGDLSGASGPTVWPGTMPGGLGGRDGYQTLDEEQPAESARPPPKPPANQPPPGAFQV
ncbi:hypothetical protein ONZ45_g887 [Pleurotus djamor]|nr:hypothetical protein ONZ45_g887 [Pleurotus djamor]